MQQIYLFYDIMQLYLNFSNFYPILCNPESDHLNIICKNIQTNSRWIHL